MGVDAIIAHPGYDEKSRNRANDIGLVRLWADANYTDFVKPICLPSTLSLSRSDPSTGLHSVGWGRTLTGKF